MTSKNRTYTFIINEHLHGGLTASHYEFSIAPTLLEAYENLRKKYPSAKISATSATPSGLK